MSDMREIGRRSALARIGATMAVASAAGAVTAAPPRPAKWAAALDLASAAGRLRAYMMMRGALDDRVVIGCVSGRYHGVVDAETTPLFGVLSATFARYRPLASGGHAAVSMEYAFFTDLATGKALTEFRNPYTGEMVEVPAGGFTPARTTIRPDLTMTLGQDVPGLTFEHGVLPPEARGDDVWFTETTRTSRSVSGSARPFRYGESTILHARASELAVPGAMRVACDTGFTNVVGWRPWLKMGDRPGHMMAFGAGRYGTTIDELPPAWLEAARARHTELLADPAAILAPVWNML